MKILIIFLATAYCLNSEAVLASEIRIAFNVGYREIITSGADPDYYKLPSEVELTPAEFEEMKKLLLKAISNYNKPIIYNSDFSIGSLAQYGVQYKVALTKRGEKEVWINGFCKGSGDMYSGIDLTSTPVVVFDGGSCYFNLTVNLKKRKSSKVIIHGFA